MRPPLIFWVFNSPPPPPGADGPHRGRGHVGRHCLYINNIWCGSVQALLRYRSKTAKIQKFPIDSHSNENFICPFFRPPGAANPQKGRRHIRNQNTPACELWRESAAGCREIIDRTNKQTSASVELTQTAIRIPNSFSTGDRFQCFYMEGQKASYAACKPLFLAVAEI